MRTFWIGTGWKMNKTVAQTRSYVAALRPLLPARRDDVRLFIIPPFTALSAAREAIGDAPLLLGAQNMHWADAGAYTGEISAPMLQEWSIDLVELGHSERRAECGETDETINRKVKTALRYGMRPLVCVGDSSAEFKAAASAQAVVRQVRLAFADVAPADLGRCLVAYEPIWAIGESGVPATVEHVRHVHAAIHEALGDLTPHPVPVLYGGSVNPGNARGFAAEDLVDGLFIGRSAWEAKGFAAMIDTAVAARHAVYA